MKGLKAVLLFILSTYCLMFNLKEIRNSYLRKCFLTKEKETGPGLRLIFNSGLALIDLQTTGPRRKENFYLINDMMVKNIICSLKSSFSLAIVLSSG